MLIYFTLSLFESCLLEADRLGGPCLLKVPLIIYRINKFKLLIDQRVPFFIAKGE